MATKREKASVNAAEVKVERIDGQQVLTLKVAPEIEELFKSTEVLDSDKYKNLNGEALVFYELKPEIKKIRDAFNFSSERTNRDVSPIGLTSYGSSLTCEDGSEMNLSLLRTEGISNGITLVLEGLNLENEVESWIQSLRVFLGFLYRNYISRREISATIEIEI